MQRDILYFIWQYADLHAFIIPLGIIGLWRWSVWLLKELIALRYRPTESQYKGAVTIITPVYNEDPGVFKQALYSWKKNKPSEIIAVIDYTDLACIKVFKMFARANKRAILIITKAQGKRPALAKGIKKAKSEILALVDSDTIWASDVIKNGLPPFVDNKVAGVGTYQSVFNPKTLAQRIFDTQLDLRYCDDMAFLGASGDALICLSGRTAFYRRKVILPMLPDLVNETFMGQLVISGDDKRLTYLVLAHGWKVRYQSNSHVYTPGMRDLSSYFKQRLRWTRNSLRADLRALKEGWVFKHKALVFFQLDKIAQAIVVILSPIYFFVALLTGVWQLALLILLWWSVSRLIKMSPHLRRRPGDIVILPIFIVYSFLTAVIKVYAIFTLNNQGWITRWDKERLQSFTFFKLAPAYAGTLGIILLLSVGVFLFKQYTFFIPQEEHRKLVAAMLPTTSTIALANQTSVLGAKIVKQKELLVKKYVMRDGDTLASVAQKYDVTIDNLLHANASRITNWNTLEPGFILSIPGKDMVLSPQRFNYQRIYKDNLGITYDSTSNTITVSGRGIILTLADIKNSVGKERLEEVKPGVWYLKSNLSLRSGVTLNLDKNEATWIKMASSKKGFVFLQAFNAAIYINGVKITSWDEKQNDFDREIKDGRSYIMVKDNSRMDLYSADIGYLGYARTPDLNASPYGIAWKMSKGKLLNTLLTGEVINSRFHNNYFGAYTFGATGMVWRGNKLYDNVRYGLDPHDDSNGFLVENNVAYNKGAHGIIFSKRCMYNTIRNNYSYNNKLHGIMLHEKSDNNIIENNIFEGNMNGIALWRASNNIVRNNIIRNNKHGIRVTVESRENIIEYNRITGSRLYGIYLYEDADKNIIQENIALGNDSAIYIKTKENIISRNTLENYRIGVYFLEKAGNNIVSENKILYNTSYGIYTKTNSGLSNPTASNVLYRNRKDIVARKSKTLIDHQN